MPNNTKALFDLLDWKGGTIYQISDVFDVPAETLLHGMPSKNTSINSPFMLGCFAFSTCTKEFVKTVILKENRGNVDFWLGYMHEAKKSYLQPLTVESIEKFYYSPDIAGTYFPTQFDKAVAIVRATEFAHGITK